MQFNITPELVKFLSYYSLCKLSDYLNIVNPRHVSISGTITLDEFGNFLGADARVDNA